MVPQEYGVAAQDKVEIGVKIAYAMLSKLRRDLLAGMDTVSHEQERTRRELEFLESATELGLSEERRRERGVERP